MKKIRHIDELRIIQRKLATREAELQILIRTDWDHLKRTARPGNVLLKLLAGVQYSDGENPSWRDISLRYGAQWLLRRIIRKAENKIETDISNGLESILAKIFKRKNPVA